MKTSSQYVTVLTTVLLTGLIAVYSITVGLPGSIKTKASKLRKVGCDVSFGTRGGWRIRVPEKVCFQTLMNQNLLAPFGSESSGTQKPPHVEFEHQKISNEDCASLVKLSGNFHIVFQHNALSLECIERVRENRLMSALMTKDKKGKLLVTFERKNK